MKDYRVTYMSEKSKRTHKDFSTLEGAKRFINKMGEEHCILTI